MKTNAYVAGIGMTPFARYLERPLKSIAAQAITAAIKDSGLETKDIQAAYMGNAVAGLVTGQEMIRGEVMLRSMGLGGIGPEDLSLVELHDASAPSEIMAYEYLGLCEKGGGAALLESGATTLGGLILVNTSGGLLATGFQSATKAIGLRQLVGALVKEGLHCEIDGSEVKSKLLQPA